MGLLDLALSAFTVMMDAYDRRYGKWGQSRVNAQAKQIHTLMTENAKLKAQLLDYQTALELSKADAVGIYGKFSALVALNQERADKLPRNPYEG
jgi:hypothetical protein